MNAIRPISNYFQSLEIASPAQVIKNLKSIALPIIAMVGAHYVQKADAGFGLFAFCMSTCLAATGGAMVPACWAACAATIPTPTP